MVLKIICIIILMIAKTNIFHFYSICVTTKEIMPHIMHERIGIYMNILGVITFIVLLGSPRA